MINVSIPWDTQKLNVGILKKNHQPKFKNAQVKTGLIKPKSNFNYTVATQGDTGDIGFKDWKNYRPKSMMN